MYIEKVDIENFQAYSSASVSLSPGFNSVVGISDAGKSTFLRAIIWVLYNKPSGMEMMRDLKGDTLVTITLSDGQTISRLRSKAQNCYVIRNGKSVKEFNNFGTNVPEEVQKALGVSLAEIAPKTYEMLSVSRQMDGPFLLTGSTTDAAKILGNLSGVSILDQALSSIRPDLQKGKGYMESSTRSKKGLEASLKEFLHLDKDTERLESIGIRIKKAQEADHKLRGLTSLLEEMTSFNQIKGTAEQEIQLLSSRLLASTPLSQAQDQLTRLHKVEEIVREMEEVNLQTSQTNVTLTLNQSALSALEQEVRDTLVEAGICPLCNQVVHANA